MPHDHWSVPCLVCNQCWKELVYSAFRNVLRYEYIQPLLVFYMYKYINIFIYLTTICILWICMNIYVFNHYLYFRIIFIIFNAGEIFYPDRKKYICLSSISFLSSFFSFSLSFPPPFLSLPLYSFSFWISVYLTSLMCQRLC